MFEKSREWKEKKKKWIEKHKNINGESYWSIHYIYDGIEYFNGEYLTEKLAKEALENYNV